MAGAARVLATWERARRQRRGGRKVGSPDVSAGRAGRPRSRETTSVGQSAGRRGALAATPPATRPAPPGRLAGMDSAAAAFALDKPALGPGPPPPPALGPGDCAQARKNFTVSHLLDLEEVAAAGRLAARPAGAEAREGAAREPSGGSSGSEAAPQDGECGPGGGRGGRGNGTWGPGLAGSKGRAERPGASAAGSRAGKEGAPAETPRVAGPPRGCGRAAGLRRGTGCAAAPVEAGFLMGRAAVPGALRRGGGLLSARATSSLRNRVRARVGVGVGGGLPLCPAAPLPGRLGSGRDDTAGETEASAGPRGESHRWASHSARSLRDAAPATARSSSDLGARLGQGGRPHLQSAPLAAA